MDRLKEITSTEKLLQVIRSRKAEPPTADAGPAEALPPVTAMAPVPQPDDVPPPESPVAEAQIVPAPQLTDKGFPTDRDKSSITLVIRDVRPNQPKKAAFAEASPVPLSPVPVEAFPIDAETFPSPATADVQAIMDVGTVAAIGEPVSPRPSAGESAGFAAAGAVPVAGESSRTESAPIEPLIADEHEDMELDQEERAAAAPEPRPKTEFFKKALSGLASLKKRGAPKVDAGPGSPPEEAPANAVAAFPPKAGRIRMALPQLASLKKRATVGIDIGHDYLRLVRTVKTSGGKWEILDRRRFALPLKTPRETPEFSSFLKASLASVCGSAKRTDLWVNMSAANVDVRHVRIPKVPKKQIANAVYWTVKKETPFDEKELVLDFETQGEVIEQGIPKLAVMVYTAPRREVEELKEIFDRIGRPLTGISIVPFSMQNLLRTAWITAHDGNIASLFIGNDFSRIDIYSSDNLVMTRGIKAGMSSMVEALVDRFNERQGRRGTALTIEQGRKVIRGLSPDSPPLEPGDAGFGIPKEEIFEMILPALERLTRQAERTFEHYTTTMPGERIIRVYVSGAMNIYQPIVDYVGSQLGIPSTVLDPLSEQESAACPDVEDTRCLSERIAFGPALGLALSDNRHTPNLIFTYRDRDREASVIRINRSVFAAFIASVLLCAGVFAFQNLAIAQKREVLAGIETQMAQLGQPVDQNRLLQMAAKVTQRRQLSRGYAERYLGMVLISELAALTPENIRFTDLKINLGPVQTGDASKQAADATKAPRVEEVTVEGLILGERQLLETSLASYVMALEGSPLFRQVVVQKNAVEAYIKGEALHFILLLKVEAQVHG